MLPTLICSLLPAFQSSKRALFTTIKSTYYGEFVTWLLFVSPAKCKLIEAEDLECTVDFGYFWVSAILHISTWILCELSSVFWLFIIRVSLCLLTHMILMLLAKYLWKSPLKIIQNDKSKLITLWIIFEICIYLLWLNSYSSLEMISDGFLENFSKFDWLNIQRMKIEICGSPIVIHLFFEVGYILFWK